LSVHVNCPNFKVNSYRCDKTCCERVIREAEKQAAFSDSCPPQHELNNSSLPNYDQSSYSSAA
jgi:hypothetical protein